jgi:hypothetical protein
LTLAALEGPPDRVQAGLLEAIADPNTAVAVIALMSKHMALLLTACHGIQEARGLLQKTILECGVRPSMSDTLPDDDEDAYPHTVRVPTAVDAFGNVTEWVQTDPEIAGQWDDRCWRDHP